MSAKYALLKKAKSLRFNLISSPIFSFKIALSALYLMVQSNPVEVVVAVNIIYDEIFTGSNYILIFLFKPKCPEREIK